MNAEQLAEVCVTTHAVRRWQDRVADVPPAEAFEAIHAVLREAMLSTEGPGWRSVWGRVLDERRGPTWYAVSQDGSICVVIADRRADVGVPAAVTILVRPAPSPSRHRPERRGSRGGAHRRMARL